MTVPQVSVIVPTYNYGHFIDEAIRSVLQQNYPDIEVLVVDDGSTDDTRLRVQSFGSEVRYIYQTNAGESSARNTGIRNSRGTYIAFLDPDDTWKSGLTQLQVELLSKHSDLGLAYSWWEFIDEKGVLLPEKGSLMHRGDVLDDLLFGNFCILSMSMVRRTVFDQVGLFDPSLQVMADWDMLIRIATSGYRFAYIPEIRVKRRIHKDSAGRNTQLKFDCGRTVLDKAFSTQPLAVRADRLKTRVYVSHSINHAFEFIRDGQEVEATALLRDGLVLQPELLTQPSFYLNLAVNMCPYGYRTSTELANRLDVITKSMQRLMRNVVDGKVPSVLSRRGREARSIMTLALAICYLRGGRWKRALELLLAALAVHPLAPMLALTNTIRRRMRALIVDISVHKTDGSLSSALNDER